MEDASAALLGLTETLTIEWRFEPSSQLTEERHLLRTIGVRADGPHYEDHYITIVLPTSVDISRIPFEENGVRIVIRHEDLLKRSQLPSDHFPISQAPVRRCRPDNPVIAFYQLLNWPDRSTPFDAQ
jgi:hypothetical protein